MQPGSTQSCILLTPGGRCACRNLALTNEERILRTVYRSSTRQGSPQPKGSAFGSLSNRQQPPNIFSSTALSNQLNMSPEPVNKAYDLPQLTGNRNASRGNLYGMDQVHHSMIISDSKQGKDQKRWEIVLNKKNENTETKQKQI